MLSTGMLTEHGFRRWMPHGKGGGVVTLWGSSFHGHANALLGRPHGITRSMHDVDLVSDPQYDAGFCNGRCGGSGPLSSYMP